MATKIKEKPKAKKTWPRKHPSGTLTLSPEAWAELDNRGANRSEAFRHMVERQCAVLAVAGDNLRSMFTANEWAVLMEAVPNVPADALVSGDCWQLVEQEIIRHELAKKYKADARRLMNKLAALDLMHIWALIDGIERWLFASKTTKLSAINPFQCEELA